MQEIERDISEEKLDTLKTLIKKAICQLYENDKHLINNAPSTDARVDSRHHVGERSIVFRFAYYLQDLINAEGIFSKLNLDCEYNRNGLENKWLPSFPNGTYPDVILHKRGSNSENILVMEFKTYWNTDQTRDEEKVCEFTNESGQYKFKLGMTVLIGKEIEDVDVTIFKEGKFVVSDFMNCH